MWEKLTLFTSSDSSTYKKNNIHIYGQETEVYKIYDAETQFLEIKTAVTYDTV